MACINQWHMPEWGDVLCAKLAGDCDHVDCETKCRLYEDDLGEIGDIVTRGALPKTPESSATMDEIKAERHKEMTEFWKRRIT